MKKSVGIVTMYSPKPNYGNRLQHYAVQTVLEKMGFDTVSYCFEKDDFGTAKLLRYWLYRLTGYRLTSHREYWETEISRYLQFRKFNGEYIKTEQIQSTEDIHGKDFYVIGSDQVWNTSWYRYNPMYRHMYLLDFAEPQKRVCFAPSFGIAQLPEEWKPWFREKLEQFPMLSVRENAGAQIIRELTGREATVVLDPTMLLTDEEWRTVAQNPKGVKDGYILTYFLAPKSEEAAECLAKVRGDRPVFELLDPKNPVVRTAGPSEFLWLFDHADLVLTDSFHACVFSLLFNKPFMVFARNDQGESMHSRLETLLKKFRLERKYAASGLENDLWEHDYSEGYRVLDRERERTMEFLRKAFGENGYGNEKGFDHLAGF